MSGTPGSWKWRQSLLWFRPLAPWAYIFGVALLFAFYGESGHLAAWRELLGEAGR